MNARYILIFAFFALVQSAYCQQPELNMGAYQSSMLEREIVSQKKSVHLGQRPYLVQLFSDTIRYSFLEDSSKYYSQFGAKVMRDHIFEKKGRDYFIALDVLAEIGYAKDFSVPDSNDRGDFSFVNCRGALLQGQIGQKFTFNSGLYEVQRVATRYLDEFIDSMGVVPGWGRVKNYMVTGVDYSMSFGNISYSILPNWNIQLGYGKHFIGHGYRSLLMSDGVFNSPYVKTSATFFNGKLLYSTWYTTLQSLERLPIGDTPESLFKRKGGSFHYLSFKPVDWLELGFFEGTVWRLVDSLQTHSLPWNAFVPVIGVNSSVEGYDGVNNVYSGLNIRLNLPYSVSVYGQLLIDDYESNRTGYQIGANIFDMVVPRLNIRVEYNHLSNYTYASNYHMQSLTHFNQPIGHPSGGATDEVIVQSDYRWKRWFGRMKYNQIKHGEGPEGQWNFEYAPEILPSFEYRNIKQLEVTAGYKLNLHTDAEIFGGIILRQSYERSSIIMFGIKTNLHNSYFDF
jgi:hypothetical protein